VVRVLREYSTNPLWNVLVEVVHSLPLYNAHKAYFIEKVMPERPFISYEELAALLGVTFGEAMVILYESRMTREEVEWELARRERPRPRFRRAAMGGTFNEIHYGHVALLLTAFTSGEHVVIGVTSDELVSKLGKQHPVKSYGERVEGLKQFLQEHGLEERSTIAKLEDPYGPPAYDGEIEALVASPFTAGRVEEINRIRVEKGLEPVKLVTCPIVLAEDGKPISSTRIAAGEITPDGRVVKKL